MHLDGPEGSLDLTLLGYQFPDLAAEPHDSNWLRVCVAVRHARGTWAATDPCLLTYEVAALADWFEAIAAGTEPEPGQDFLEPCLRFELRDSGAGSRVLRVEFDHELRPPWAGADGGEDVYLDVAATAAVLAAAADALRAQLARYPRRAAR